MLHRIRRDERGFSLVFVGFSFMGLLAATTLAIDVGMFMVARAQAQNSADAGALAGATALARDNYDDRTAGGPAVQNAVTAAAANQVMRGNVSVLPSDVTFPTPPPGTTWIQVNVFRSSVRGNPVNTLMGVFFRVPTANVTATATAQVSPANSISRAAPFMIPDRWIENSDANGTPDGAWSPNALFDLFDRRGNPLPNPDVYIPADQPGYTGYNSERDKGIELMIRAGTGNNIEPDMYYSWDVPGGTGADWYRNNIVNGVNETMDWGSQLIQEPGDMSGPTTQGIDDLIAQDPYAYWDTDANCVKSEFGTSPRVIAIPLYDPDDYARNKQTGRVAEFKVANWLGFFVTRRQGNNIFGRIVPLIGTINNNAGPAPAGAFPKAIQLVR